MRSRHPDSCRVVVESRLYDPVVDGMPAAGPRAAAASTRGDFLDYDVPEVSALCLCTLRQACLTAVSSTDWRCVVQGMPRSLPSLANVSQSRQEAAFAWAERLRQIPDQVWEASEFVPCSLALWPTVLDLWCDVGDVPFRRRGDHDRLTAGALQRAHSLPRR